MYRLLALDIDDTLTLNAREVPDGNAAAIARAQAAGIFVTVATGRGYYGSSFIWKPLNIEGLIINYGGALITDTRTGKCVRLLTVEPELVTDALEFAREIGIHAHIYQGDAVVTEKSCAFVEKYVSFLELPLIVDPDIRKKSWQNVPKVLYLTEPEQVEDIAAAAEARYRGRLKVAKSKAGFIEINHPDAHKGAAVKWIAERMGVDQSEVCAVGDNTLDAEMIEWAGLGVAVGDAREPILKIADVIAPDCGDDAVAWVIDELLLKAGEA